MELIKFGGSKLKKKKKNLKVKIKTTSNFKGKSIM